MADSKKFELNARVNSSNPKAIESVLKKYFETRGTLTKEGEDLVIKAKLIGVSAKDLNRELLSELRRTEKKTRLRAEWSDEKTTQRFFDYVLRKTEKRA
jgi:hypothetical protein